MSDAFRFGLLGLASGGIYTLLALGIIVGFRASGAVNFANGAIGMVTGFVVYDLAQRGISMWICVLAGVAAAVLCGLIINFGVMRPLHRRSPLTKAIGTLALLVIAESAATLRYGSDPKAVASLLPSAPVTILGARVSWDYVIIFLLSVGLTAGLGALYRYTTFGLATAAHVENEDALAALGWSSGKLALINWAIAGLLAGLAGALLAPITAVQSVQASTLLIPALAVALFGQMSSFPFALGGGLLIGVIQAELTRFGQTGFLSHIQGLSDAIPFLIIVVVLALRGRSIPSRSFVGDTLPKVGSPRANWPLIGGVFVVMILATQVLLSDEWVASFTTCMVAALVLLSVVVVTGYAGQLSLAQLSFAGVSALVAAHLASDLHASMPVAAIVGILSALPLGLLVGLPAVRARGVSLAVITLGLAAALNAMLFQREDATGGINGIVNTTTSFFGIDVSASSHPRRYALLTLIILTLSGIAVMNLRRSAVGRRMVAVRSNERAASSLGIHVPSVKLYAFVVSAGIAGVAGAVLVFRSSTALFGSGYDPFASINAVVEATVGGVGYISGATVGSTLDPGGVGNDLLSKIGISSWLPFIGGVLLLITVLIQPDGIVAKTISDFRRIFPDKRATRIPDSEDATGAVESKRSVLEVRSLSVRFGQIVALSDVNLRVEGGEVVGIIGPNGAGKTTLIDAVTGYVASQGVITLDEQSIGGLPPHLRSRAGITRSFQSLELFEDLTVAENLLSAEEFPRLRWVSCLVRPGKPVLSGAALSAARELGLTGELDHLPESLPYGKRRLLAISRALAARPRVLLLDEPAAGLSLTDRGELVHLLRRMARDWGMAILLVEHDVDLVMAASDRVVALDFGRVIASGAPDAVRSDPEVIRCYLGTAAQGIQPEHSASSEVTG